MNLEELMETLPEDLAERQHKELKKHVLKTLSTVHNLIKSENYEQVKDLLFFSPAGDGYGIDSHCINFSYSDEEMDIQEIAERLNELKSVKEEESK